MVLEHVITKVRVTATDANAEKLITSGAFIKLDAKEKKQEKQEQTEVKKQAKKKK